MHAFLILGEESEPHIVNLLTTHKAKRIDTVVKTIEEARNLTKQTSFSLNEKTAIVLPGFSDVTPQAQNALLKLIEEPQENLMFILTSVEEEGILPTIFSRVEIIRNNNKQEQESDSEFFSLSVGEKLTKTSKIKTRDEALFFVSSLLQSAHKLLLKENMNPTSVAAIAKAHQNLKRNGNIQLQLTNLVTQL